MASRHGAWLVLDETFGLPAIPLQAGPVELVDGVVHVYSLSKAGLAAERLGIIAADPGIIAVLCAGLRADAIAASYLGQLLAAALLRWAAAADPSPLGALYGSRWQVLRRALEPALAADAAAAARWQGGPFLWLCWRRGPDGETVFRKLLRCGVGVTPRHGAARRRRAGPRERIGLGAPPDALEQAGEQVQAVLRAALAG